MRMIKKEGYSQRGLFTKRYHCNPLAFATFEFNTHLFYFCHEASTEATQRLDVHAASFMVMEAALKTTVCVAVNSILTLVPGG